MKIKFNHKRILNPFSSSFHLPRGCCARVNAVSPKTRQHEFYLTKGVKLPKVIQEQNLDCTPHTLILKSISIFLTQAIPLNENYYHEIK